MIKVFFFLQERDKTRNISAESHIGKDTGKRFCRFDAKSFKLFFQYPSQIPRFSGRQWLMIPNCFLKK